MEGAQSVFTRIMIDGLESGKADLNRDGVVTVECELYEFVLDRMRQEVPIQEPRKGTLDIWERLSLLATLTWHRNRRMCLFWPS